MALTNAQLLERQPNLQLDHLEIDNQMAVKSASDLQDYDSDNDESPKAINKPLVGVEQRRAQVSIFESYVADKAKSITKEQAKVDLKSAKDEELSVASILAKQENETINDPREYQIELFDRAKKENIIAVLDTGSGKTLIAVLLLRYILDKELEDRAAGNAPKLSFFLVPSVALVFQQSTVLECNLDYKIARRYGSMRTDSFEKSVWDTHLNNDMVIVCTAEILNQALSHSLIQMQQINILIFDEAHHAKGEHPYATIVRQFYKPLKAHLRPRIFGMTASPVDAKEDVKLAALELENLLKCKIATTPISDKFRSQAKEHIVYYPRLSPSFETPLYQQLNARFGHMKIFERLFQSAKEASSDIGRWGSDNFWHFALGDEGASTKSEAKIHRDITKRHGDQSVEKLDAETRLFNEAERIVVGHYFGRPTATLQDVSTKVLKLHDILNAHYERPTNNRCIVFVERRTTARLLQLIFNVIGSPNLHVGILTGMKAAAGDLKESFRKQVMTMKKFREGDLNCLFATSVAEEGIDVPDCNLVIRFDLCKTMIQFVQSKGRARHMNSKFIELVEDGNLLHKAAVRDVRKDAEKMRIWCTTLPKDRILQGNDYEIDSNDKMAGRSFTHPETHARLTYPASLVILSLFSASLAYEDRNTNTEPLYIMSVDGDHYICEVILPETSPIRTARGHRYKRKALAKRSAAFEMCINLLKKNFLNANLLSVYKKRLPAFRNAQLALRSKKQNQYPMKLKPYVWSEGRGTFPTELYLTILDVSNGLHRPHQPLGLLTRAALPDLPQFPLFLDSGQITMAVIRSLPKRMSVNVAILDQMTIFTHRLWKDINAKIFEIDVTNMSYWIVPIVADDLLATIEDPELHIDWNILKIVFEIEEYAWTPEMDNSFLEHKLLVDRYSGNRRFFSIGVTPAYKPLDPVPENTVKAGGKNRFDILAYSISLWGKSGAAMREKCKLDQPVVETEQILHRQNWLAEPEAGERERLTKAYLCPEPLKISALPTKIVSMSLVFPAIIHRIEDYLIALEACDIVGIKINPALALEACTKDSDNSDEHQEERINFRSGMGPNYERLEFMGDCFLKMATSIALFGQNPNDDEFDFHVNRMVMICNKNLYKTALELDMPQYVRSLPFSRRLWYPEALKLLHGKSAGKGGNGVIKHSLGDKSVADVCEAMIGAAFIQYNKPGDWKPSDWDSAVRATSKMVNNEDHVMMKWDDYFAAYELPAYQIASATASQKALVDSIERKMGYRFNYPRLLRSAFCHASHPYEWEKIPNYQRLEFLGDSLLDTACVTHLFYNYPEKDPQWLTEHKMAMVTNKFLGAVCVKLGFHKHLRYSHSQVQFQTTEYVQEIEAAAEKADGEVDYWIGVKDPPKCLPDIVEAYVGALFVDSSFDYSLVQSFFNAHIKPFFLDMTLYDTFANNHPTTHLHNLLSIALGCQKYRLLAKEMPLDAPGAKIKVMAALVVHDVVVCHGVAVSGRYAKLAASKNALQVLSRLAPFEFRAKFGCGCSKVGDGEGVESEDAGVTLEDVVGTAI